MTNVVIDMPAEVYVGHECEFDVAITDVSSTEQGTMVVGKGVFPAEGNYQIWYKEGDEWVEFTEKQDPDQYFGPASGFPLMEATSYFKVKFNEAISAEFTVQILDAETKSQVLYSGSAQVVAVEPESIEALNARVALGGDVVLNTDVWGTVNIGNDVAIDGAGYALHGNIVLDAVSDTEVYTVSVKGLRMVPDASSSGYGIVGQNQTADQPVKPVKLTLSQCDISRYERKAIYLTNAQQFEMYDCIIGDVATAEMDDPNTYGDYAVDLNLCGVSDAVVCIQGNTFTASCGAIGAVKVTQRGGIADGVPLTDDVNTDIKNPTSATIRALGIDRNDFSAMTGEGVADVVIGSSPNADGTARTYNTAYPATVGAFGATDVRIRGGSDGDMEFHMDSGSTLVSMGAVSATGKDNTLDITTTGEVTMTGPVRDGTTIDLPIDWTYPETGPQGGAFLGYKRLILQTPALQYIAGGFRAPLGFRPMTVLSVSAKGGAVGYFDTASRRIVIYQNGAEASGTLEDVTIVLIGN